MQSCAVEHPPPAAKVPEQQLLPMLLPQRPASWHTGPLQTGHQQALEPDVPDAPSEECIPLGHSRLHAYSPTPHQYHLLGAGAGHGSYQRSVPHDTSSHHKPEQQSMNEQVSPASPSRKITVPGWRRWIVHSDARISYWSSVIASKNGT